jgi:hypothetical protein
MNLINVFNISGEALAHVTQFTTSFATSQDGASGPVKIDVPGVAATGGTVTVAKKYIDNGTQHATTVAFNYGNLLSSKRYVVPGGAPGTTAYQDYVISDIVTFQTVWNCIYNNTYSWDWDWTSNGTFATPRAGYNAVRAFSAANTKGMPALDPAPGGTTPDPFVKNATLQIIYSDFTGGTIGLDMIFGTSTWDGAYNKLLINGGYNASLAFDAVTDAKFVTTASGVEEYYTVTVDNAANPTVLNFTEKSGTTNPTADVPSTLVLKMKDMYSHTVEVKVPVILKRR